MHQAEQRVFWVSGIVVLLAYSATLAVAHNLSLPAAIPAGLANTLPTLLFGAAAYWIITRCIVDRAVTEQIAAHFVMAALFAVLTYWLLIVMLGLLNGVSATRFEVRPLVSRGMAWQSLQNVTTYGVVALLAYLSRRSRNEAPVKADSPPQPREALSRYFVRRGDDIIPVDVDAIVSISGADDYAEVATATDRHLARMTLAAFERALSPARFARVHRSTIVNLQRITRAEPAGSGRLLLHLSNGDSIVTSRAGAMAMRERVL